MFKNFWNYQKQKRGTRIILVSLIRESRNRFVIKKNCQERFKEIYKRDADGGVCTCIMEHTRLRFGG